jgi:putative ABC transport system substrate-binding protein
MGYVEGRNVAIEYRWAEGHFERLPAMVADLVHRQVAVIAIAGSTSGALAAKAATAAIPIVFSVAGDPVKLDLVASLNRPGGNLTGITVWNAELVPKRLELLHAIVPAATTVALLVNPTSPIVAEAETTYAQTASRTLGLQLHVLNASDESEIDTALATLAQRGSSALLIGADVVFFDHREHIVALAARHSIPTTYDRREFATAGGLMSYGTSILDVHRKVGVYVGRILKGEKPADLPVMLPTTFQLVINLKTAKALGIDIPTTLLAQADEHIASRHELGRKRGIAEVDGQPPFVEDDARDPCMVRPCVARGVRRTGMNGLASMYPASDSSSLCFRPSWISARLRPR